MITPVMATQAVEEQGNFTPLPFVVFGGDVHRSNAQGPNIAKVSFTDDFLRAVRLWQTAAEVPPQPPMHPDDDLPGDNEHDQNFETEFDNLDVLQDFPGEQEWIFFRPDPNNLGRAETLQLRVTAATTMRDIEIYLAAAWPDLLPGRPDWEVQMAVQYAFDDLHAPLAPGQSGDRTTLSDFAEHAHMDLDDWLGGIEPYQSFCNGYPNRCCGILPEH